MGFQEVVNGMKDIQTAHVPNLCSPATEVNRVPVEFVQNESKLTPWSSRWQLAAEKCGLAVQQGMAFVEAFIDAGEYLRELRKSLNSQGVRNDKLLPEDKIIGWVEGCETFLGVSRSTAERWIASAARLACLRGIAEGETDHIPSTALEIPHADESDSIPVDDEIRHHAKTRLEAVASGDCSPHRAWLAFAGGLMGGNPGKNPTGRQSPDEADQLWLDFDRISNRSTQVKDAWASWGEDRRSKARETLRGLIRGLPADLKKELSYWIKSDG